MRRPSRNPPTSSSSSSSSLSSSSSTTTTIASTTIAVTTTITATTTMPTTTTTSSVSKEGCKMTWKNTVNKIGKHKLIAESITDNTEIRKSGKTIATATTTTDNDLAKTHPNKSSLMGKKRSVARMGKRTRNSFSDHAQIKSARRAIVASSPSKDDIETAEMVSNFQMHNDIENNIETNEITDHDDMVQNSSASAFDTPISTHLQLFEQDEHLETNGPTSSNLLEFMTNSALTQSSPVIDDTERTMESVGYGAEDLSEESEVLKCSTATNINRELTDEEKHMILVDFDAGMLPHEIEEKYGISKLQIADVLSNRISIFRTNWSDLFTLKRRRTVYVRLNMQMWDYFCQCRDQKIWLNGRQLKEQALKIAHELGLHSFKASEGWLDSFKRRHCIDLKAMTGKPVIYETEPEEGNPVNDGLEIKISHSTTSSPRMLRDANSMPTVLDANKFLMDATDAAVFASSGGSGSDSAISSPTQATAAIQTTSPLDIQRFLPSSSIINEQNVLPATTVNASAIGASAIQALVETCCYRVNEIEVAQAVDTLRAYIVSNNINLLPVLVELQKGLAATAAQRRATRQDGQRDMA